jgi:hypothetical protein
LKNTLNDAGETGLGALGIDHQYPNASHAISLLRPRPNRQCRRAAAYADEFGPLHGLSRFLPRR